MIKALLELAHWLAGHNLELPEVILKFPTRSAAGEAQMALLHDWDLRLGPQVISSDEFQIAGFKVRFTTGEKTAGNSWLNRHERSWSDYHRGDGST